MITVWGKLYKNGKTLLASTCTSSKPDFSDALLECLESFAKDIDIEVPMWHSNPVSYTHLDVYKRQRENRS